MDEGAYEPKWSFENNKKLFLSYFPEIFWYFLCLVICIFEGGGGGAVVTNLFSCTAVSKTNMHGVICRGFFAKDHETVKFRT